MADQSVYDGISDVSFDYVYDNLGNITESYITEFDTNTTLTGPLQQVVDSGIIQLFPLG